jgi:uncharacterized protein (DUF849 family)
MIQAALNGGRTLADNAAVPTTPARLAEEARGAVAAGAACLHFHVRDAQGRESIAAADVSACINAVRAACPGVPLGVSTGAWILGDAEARLAAVKAWSVLPDYVSINLREDGAFALAELVLGMGIGIEAGVWDAADVDLLVQSELAPRCLRILMEPMEHAAPGAIANAQAMLAALAAANVAAPRLLHGVEAAAWPVLAFARQHGHDTRIGFEDVLILPDCTPAPSNAALIAAALQL